VGRIEAVGAEEAPAGEGLAVPTVGFRADVGELIREIDRFGAAAPAAEARALNAAMAEAQREAIDRISDAMGVAPAVVSKETAVVKATPDRLEATLVVTGRRIPAIAFHAVQNGEGVSYQVGGRVITIPHAFIERTRSGHVAVFRRARGAGFAFGRRRRQVSEVAPSGLVERLPIFERRGPAAGAFLDRPEVFGPVKNTTELALIENLETELEKLQERRGRA
jgi:hypothetical protein